MPPDPALNNSSSDSEPPPQSLLSDHLASCEPIEATLEELGAIADAHNMHLVMWELTTLLPGETLQQHVLVQQAGGGVCAGPHQEVRGGLWKKGDLGGRCFFGKGACRGGVEDWNQGFGLLTAFSPPGRIHSVAGIDPALFPASGSSYPWPLSPLTHHCPPRAPSRPEGHP